MPPHSLSEPENLSLPSSDLPEGLQVVGEGRIHMGRRTQIAPHVQLIFQQPGEVRIGDYCHLGQGVKIVCNGGRIDIGDWTSLHDHCLLLCGAGLSIGEHGWFGQHSVLDGTGGLKIGNGVRVGMYSQIWSHVAAGEQIEGCTLFGERGVYIEDDVWLVGSCIVGSGVTLGRRSIALIGSNITKSWPAGSVLAGTPATPKPNLAFYRPVSLDDKWRMLSGWLAEAAQVLQLQLHTDTELLSVADAADASVRLSFTKTTQRFQALLIEADTRHTLCDLEAKTYTKRLTSLEQRVLKWLAGNKARFLSAP